MSYALRVNKQCKHFDKYHESWLFKLAIYSRFFNNHRQCQIVRFLRWEIEEEENAPWYQTWVKYLILCLGFKLCLFVNKSVNWARIMPAEGGIISLDPLQILPQKRRRVLLQQSKQIYLVLAFSLAGLYSGWKMWYTKGLTNTFHIDLVTFTFRLFSRWPLISPGHFHFSSLFTFIFCCRLMKGR